MTAQKIIYVLSDSVGETAELVIKAGLSQFKNGDYKIQRIPYVEDKETIDEFLQQAKLNSNLIGFTLVNPELRAYLNKRAKEIDIEAVDIMALSWKQWSGFSAMNRDWKPALSIN